MAVHYTKALFGRIKRAGLRPVTIDAGGGIVFQGGVSEEVQLILMNQVLDLRKRFPDEAIPLPGESILDRDARLATLTIPGMDSEAVVPAPPPPAPPPPPPVSSVPKNGKPHRKSKKK